MGRRAEFLFTLPVVVLLSYLATAPTLVHGYPLSIWVVRDQITSPEKVETVIKLARAAEASRLYVQVVGRMDAYYNSRILPRAEALADQRENFDPLDMILRLAKKEGIKISAWMNVFYAWPFTSRPKSPEHVVNKRPDWVTYDQEGRSMLEYTRPPEVEAPGIFLEPALPEVRNFIASVAEEIAKNYEVDEVHLDYIRYPFRTFGYHPRALEAYRAWFREVSRTRKVDSSRAFDEFRIEQVSLTVKEVYERVRRFGRNLSAAVFANYEGDALPNRLQDWMRWLRDGYLDFACLMAYSPDPAVVAYHTSYAKQKLSNLSRVRIGLGAYRLHDQPERLIDIALRVVRERPDEIVIFSFEDLARSEKMLQLVRNIASM